MIARTIVAIPAYNCATQLERVLNGVDERLMGRVEEFWVFDNRSTDGTLAAAVEYQRQGRIPNLRVFQNDVNVNLGGTHKIAFDKARTIGATHVAILHGDDQATTEELHDLLDIASSSVAVGAVLGSRFNGRSRLRGYDWKRIAGNKVLNLIYSATAGRRLEDLGSGLNIFEVARLDPKTYHRFADALTFNFELILDLVARRVPFTFVPITWEESDQVSNARNVNVFLGALRILTRWRLVRPTSQPAVDQARYSSTEIKG
ncbi:glycosyltransferase family 2 protein [Cryobacterium sp. 1639]|uniref:glycosyltransferase family 2 protein n=1 Tax=Cryobacterium inferilacus TaxID=2866629 RepID=UPI001C73394C|nr:glycosyltransferase family 2 protein [Cryobacterium sp. 1639]MBX0301945.1 glycosyltransferase family 2 protein [Cryobacterium sp. 1639]